MPAAVSPQTPGFRVPAVEPDKNGTLLFSKVWYLFFQQLAAIFSGDSGNTIFLDDLEQNPPVIDVAAIQQMFATFRQGIDQRPLPDVYSAVSVDDQSPSYQELLSQIAELRSVVQSLQQGNIVL